MVRKYVRKGQRRMWSESAMRAAIEAVIKKGISIKRASIDNEVPHATLSRKIHQCRLDPEKEIELITNPKGSNFQTVFSKEQEIILCQYISTLENQLVGLNGVDIRRLAFQVAEKFKLPHRFNKDFGTAGEDWYRGFLKRNPEVIVKKCDSLNGKTRGFNKELVYKFFDLLENTIKKYQLEASDIYNLDETVITCISKSDSKITSIGNNQSENFVQTEQNKLVTAVICFSASGSYVPLMLIFPRKTKCKSLLNGAPPGALAEFDPTGQMQINIFIKWLKSFIEFSKASKNSPVLLLVDGYRSYLKTLQVLEIAKENGIIILCLPSCCTDKLRPVHSNFIKLLSKTYANEVTEWLNTNPGCSVSMTEIYELFGNAFTKVSTAITAINSFSSTGIWPPDRDIFDEDLFTSVREEISNADENNSQTSSEFLKSAVGEACHKITLNDTLINKLPTTTSDNVVHEPIVVITQSSSQPYVVQSVETINDQNRQELLQLFTPQSFIQQQYQVVKQQSKQPREIQNHVTESQMIVNSQEDDMCPVIIPPEAQLSEVQVGDLQSLMNSQRKLYFYVSPYRLKLS